MFTWRFIYFFLFDHAQSMWKFPEQGLHLCHSSDPSCSSDNARSLTRWAMEELLHEALYNNVHRSFIHNSPKLETNQMSNNNGRNFLKLWYIQQMEHYSAIKRIELVIHTTWMNLKYTMLSKETKHEKAHIVWLHLWEILEQTKLTYSNWKELSIWGVSRGTDQEGAWGNILGWWKDFMSWYVIVKTDWT